jgi:hypothetical protein
VALREGSTLEEDPKVTPEGAQAATSGRWGRL